ncbi:DUF2314 domain-containing protein [Microbulbifer sp. SSSA005]|uniref:DUF2314 domain-containing protein n=1 Tax=unclassified Microbulbifer TaxID=2619833 RepID=UPI00403ACCA6
MTEPLFRNTHNQDQEMLKASAQASNTIGDFINLVKSGPKAIYAAKLRFRDPDLSEKLGEDRFLYLWLSDVYFHVEENFLSGVFFDVPEELRKWHQVGERLGFDPEDLFDWMVIENGHAIGAYTLRVTREQLGSEKEKQEYDSYIGISSYEPI